jgi:hypothetical protein
MKKIRIQETSQPSSQRPKTLASQTVRVPKIIKVVKFNVPSNKVKDIGLFDVRHF